MTGAFLTILDLFLVLPVGLPSPLVRLCRVWVDADGSVTVSNGRIGFLHLYVDTTKNAIRHRINERRKREKAELKHRLSPRPLSVEDC